jgi:hypothetical protein
MIYTTYLIKTKLDQEKRSGTKTYATEGGCRGTRFLESKRVEITERKRVLGKRYGVGFLY